MLRKVKKVVWISVICYTFIFLMLLNTMQFNNISHSNLFFISSFSVTHFILSVIIITKISKMFHYIKHHDKYRNMSLKLMLIRAMLNYMFMIFVSLIPLVFVLETPYFIMQQKTLLNTLLLSVILISNILAVISTIIMVIAFCILLSMVILFKIKEKLIKESNIFLKNEFNINEINIVFNVYFESELSFIEKFNYWLNFLNEEFCFEIENTVNFKKYILMKEKKKGECPPIF